MFFKKRKNLSENLKLGKKIRPTCGNNERTFAAYVELEFAVDEYSPNSYLFKRFDSVTNKPVSERTWYVGIPI